MGQGFADEVFRVTEPEDLWYWNNKQTEAAVAL